jgi:uncharacterized protein (DUF427 family)
MPRAVWNGAVIAESDDVEVVDGYTYFPAETVARDHLRPSDHHTVCPWKGTASYYDVVVDGEVNLAAAWYYPDPNPRAAPLVGGRIGFWRGVRIDRGDDADARRGGIFARLAGRRR